MFSVSVNLVLVELRLLSSIQKKYKYFMSKNLGNTSLEEIFRRTVRYESTTVFRNYSAGLCHVISDALRRCQMIVSAKNSVQKDNKVVLQQVHFGSVM